MSTFETDLERNLEVLASEIDTPDTGERVLRRVHTAARLSKWRRGGLAFVAGVAAASAASFYVAHTHIPDERALSSQGQLGTLPDSDQIKPVEPGQPCPGAEHVSTPGQLAALTHVPIWTAANSKLTDAWTCGDTPVLMYGAIQISYETGWENVDAATEWASLARDYGGAVQTILGRPAYVHIASSQGPRMSVSFVVNGTLVRILANNTVPIQDLLRVAKDLDVPSETLPRRAG